MYMYATPILISVKPLISRKTIGKASNHKYVTEYFKPIYTLIVKTTGSKMFTFTGRQSVSISISLVEVYEISIRPTLKMLWFSVNAQIRSAFLYNMVLE